MARPTSFRLPEELLGRLESEAVARGMSMTALAARLLDEGLKTRRHPGIVYRDGPTGRRARLPDGPDIWEIVRDLGGMPSTGEQRVRDLSEETGLTPDRIHLALDYYL